MDKAMRFNEGKPRPDLVPWYLTEEIEEQAPRLKALSELIFKLLVNERNPLLADCDRYEIVCFGDDFDPHHLVALYTKGAEKYAPMNWCKGLATSRILASVARHLYAVEFDGQEKDPETGLPHLVHAYWGVLAFRYFLEQGALVNDYYVGASE
jgi:hypothetical protein